MGKFETANDIVILDAGRRVEWGDQTPTGSVPTASTDGVDVANSPTVDIFVEPSSGTPTFDIYVYLGANQNGPADWAKWRTDFTTDGDNVYERFDDMGAVDRVAIVESNLSTVKIGRAIQE